MNVPCGRIRLTGFTLTEVLIATSVLALGVSVSLYLVPELHRGNHNVLQQYELDAWEQNTLTQLNQRATFRNRYFVMSTSETRHPDASRTVVLHPRTERFADWAIHSENLTFTGALSNYEWVRDPDQILVRECRGEPDAMVD